MESLEFLGRSMSQLVNINGASNVRGVLKYVQLNLFNEFNLNKVHQINSLI